jgi:hypothetical protein
MLNNFNGIPFRKVILSDVNGDPVVFTFDADGNLLTSEKENVVPLNEPIADTNVAAGGTHDVTVDVSDVSKYVVFAVVDASHTYDVAAKYKTSAGVEISAALNDAIIPSAAQASVKTTQDTLSSQITLTYTNGDAAAHNVRLYVYGKK